MSAAELLRRIELFAGLGSDQIERSVGDTVILDGQPFEVVKVFDLAPPRGDFAYLHATCRPMREEGQ